MIVETDVCIPVLMNFFSSLFVNLLISLDIGQVEISCDNQLGPLIQLPLFDDNSSGKHPLNGRSAIFFFPGRCYQSVLVNSLTSLTRFCIDCLYCFFSYFESTLTLLLNQLNIEPLILGIFLLSRLHTMYQSG